MAALSNRRTFGSLMNRFSEKALRAWAGLGLRFLPFADSATPELPLSRLLRLSLFQVPSAWRWCCWSEPSTA